MDGRVGVSASRQDRAKDGIDDERDSMRIAKDRIAAASLHNLLLSGVAGLQRWRALNTPILSAGAL